MGIACIPHLNFDENKCSSVISNSFYLGTQIKFIHLSEILEMSKTWPVGSQENFDLYLPVQLSL